MKEFDIEHLKDYLSNSLSKEERDSFESRLQSDPDFRQQFQIQKSLLDGIEYHFDKQMKQSLNDHENKRKKRKLSLITAIAASFLIVAIFSYRMWDMDPQHSELFQKYYKPYYNVIDDPQRDSSVPGDDGSAFQLYDKGEYDNAIVSLRNALMANPNNAEALLYLGLSYLAVNQPDSAVLYLNKGSQQASTFTDPAEWYLGLAYLRAGKNEMAKKVFTEISGKNSGYRNRAESILKEL